MPVAYFDVSTAGVGMEEGLARGRERVAMTTPDETTATAVFVKRWEGVFFSVSRSGAVARKEWGSALLFVGACIASP